MSTFHSGFAGHIEDFIRYGKRRTQQDVWFRMNCGTIMPPKTSMVGLQMTVLD